MTQLILVGGFLGAGKTTLLWTIAQQLVKEGKRVALITNDQAPALVDSKLLKQAGLKVAEVAGSCFCCNFNGFVEAISSLQKDTAPDVIIAEPVGSCTDLTATIIRPLQALHKGEVRVSPLTVLSDPSRLQSVLEGQAGGLHEDAAYIYRKQLEESDIILITKTDTLDASALELLVKNTQLQFPSSQVMTASSLTGNGLSAWFETATGTESKGDKHITVDYDTYAHGEAVLGWLNGTLALSGETIDGDDLLQRMLKAVADRITAEQLRVGHIKIMIENGSQYAIGNITGDATTLQQRGHCGESTQMQLTINARIETSPEHLDQMMQDVLVDTINGQCDTDVLAWRYLMPGRPNPTHHID